MLQHFMTRSVAPWRRAHRDGGSRRRRCRLTVEALEDRLVLSSDMVLQWNDILLDAIRADRTPPSQGSRAMAIVQAAIYEAVNSIEQVYAPYLVQIPAPANSSPEAAVASSITRMLWQLVRRWVNM